jgi:flavodoxin
MNNGENVGYGEAIESTSYTEYCASEAELTLMMGKLNEIIEKKGREAVPQWLLARITKLSQESTRTLRDWLEATEIVDQL